MILTAKKKNLIVWLGTLLLLGLITYICFQSIVKGEKTFIWGGDNTLQSYAWMGKIWNSLRHGEIAMWDFNQYSGSSFAGEIQTAPFYVGNILFAIFTPSYNQHALDLYILFHYWLASVFMFGFLRYNKQNWLACITGAILFSYIGSVSARSTGQSNIFMSLIYLPAVIWSFQAAVDTRRKMMKSRGVWYFVLSGALLGTMVLAGHMQPYFHTVIALGLFTVCYSKSMREFGTNIISLIIVGIISLIASFGQVISGLEYMNLSYRWVGLSNPVNGFGSLPGEAYDFVVAKISNLKDIVINNEIGDGCTLYISIAGAMLFCIGVWAICYRWKEKTWEKKLGIYAIVTTIVCVFLSFGRQNVFGLLLTMIPGFSSVREPARILFVYDFSVAITVSIGITFVANLLGKTTIKAIQRISITGILSWIWGLAAVIAVLFYAVDYNAGKQAPAIGETTGTVQYEKNELIEFMIDEVSKDIDAGFLYRYTCDTLEETLTPNLGSVYNELLGTHGHRATMSVKYFDYLGNNGWNWNEKLADDFAVKYLVTQSGADSDRFSNYTYLKTINDHDVYIRHEPQNYISLWTDEEKSRELKAESIEKKTNSISFASTVPEDGMIRLAQMYYPGWTAIIDGKTVEIDEDENGFIWIKVDAGAHEIQFCYKPWWGIAWIIIIAIFGISCCVYEFAIIRKIHVCD